MEDIILIGLGGHAKSVIDSIEKAGRYRIIGYTDNKSWDNYRGYKYLGDDSVLDGFYKQGIRNVFITIGYLGDSLKRKILYEYLINIGFTLPAIIDDSAIIALDAVIKDGTFVGKGAIVNSNAKIEKMSIINTGAIIEHDCIVGEFSHISVGSILCGNVKVGKESFIGAKSVVIQELSIGSRVIIGAGSCVLIDVLDGCKVMGTVK